jgi:molybdopterin/thiamine biosynthesis adenylyltransferase
MSTSVPESGQIPDAMGPLRVTSAQSPSGGALRTRSALIVGVGGLGCPAALLLARAGVGRLVLADDDVVEASNLHRQVLFSPSDVGRPKLEAARDALASAAPGVQVELLATRFLPDNALELASSVDLVLEGSDNFATKFLAADACHLASVPVVHGAAIRWRGTAWAVPPEGRPCYRCLFEDVPGAEAGLNCSEAGVMGPVVGLVGAIMADLALRVLSGDRGALGPITTFDGQRDTLRRVRIGPRPGCPLCGPQRQIFDLTESRYIDGHCAA